LISGNDRDRSSAKFFKNRGVMSVSMKRLVVGCEGDGNVV
jgi:hypothetical protein